MNCITKHAIRRAVPKRIDTDESSNDIIDRLEARNVYRHAALDGPWQQIAKRLYLLGTFPADPKSKKGNTRFDFRQVNIFYYVYGAIIVAAFINFIANKTAVAGKNGENLINLTPFNACILVFGFILAFARWQIENRQNGIAKIFERKQAANKLIMDDKTGCLAGLIQAAFNTDTVEHEFKQLNKFESEKLLLNLLSNARADSKLRLPHIPRRDDNAPGTDGGKITEEEKKVDDKVMQLITKKMFVYVELDNLEFALIQFQAGYLDHDQMFRACEIMESRLQNLEFRHLAVIQGFSYYTDDFHRVLASLIVFGSLRSLPV